MFAIFVLVVLAVGVAIGRAVLVARVEREDAARPRGPDGIFRGAEPFTFERPGAPAVLLVHGGGDTPQTLRGLGEFLRERGFAVSAPLLPGHGRSVREFRQVDPQGWRAAVHAAHAELATRHRWVGIVGLSMGAALAAIEAAQFGDVPALVLIAPFVDMPRRTRMAVAVSRVAGVVLPYIPATDPRSIRDPAAAARGLAFGVFTPSAARALRQTADDGFESLAAVRAPTLIIQSPDDNRVAAAVAIRALERVGCPDKRLEWVQGGGHVITVDFGRERVFALTASWLESHGAQGRSPQ